MQEEHPLVQAARVLEHANLPYCLIGGYAVAVYGDPRATYDVDFLVSCSREDFKKFLERCKGLGWSAELRRADPGDPVGDVLRVYRPFAADFLRARPGLEESCIECAEQIVLFDQKVYIVRPEYLILLLLRAGDPRSFYDALGILRVQELSRERLDKEELRCLARDYGLERNVELLLRGEFRWNLRRPPGLF